jgi:predicted Fe-S protein YdhL (DUF1289 family)
VYSNFRAKGAFMDWAQQTAHASPVRHSPCVGVCKLDEKTGYCIGCARSSAEIEKWPFLDDTGRDAIWAFLPERHALQSCSVRLIPLTAGEILGWVSNTINNRLGTWVTGMPGALAEFSAAPDQDMSATNRGDFVVGQTGTASFRLRHHDKLRAFAIGQGGPIVLGFPKARLALATSAVFTKLGLDRDAIQQADRDHVLFDYGLGRKSSRFCIRTDNADLIQSLERLNGRPWPEVMACAGTQIIAQSPNRVVESALARIEVFAPIPPPGGRSPDGAHTHFLPSFLASGEEIIPSLALPEYAAPVAIFYPS